MFFKKKKTQYISINHEWQTSFSFASLELLYRFFVHVWLNSLRTIQSEMKPFLYCWLAIFPGKFIILLPTRQTRHNRHFIICPLLQNTFWCYFSSAILSGIHSNWMRFPHVTHVERIFYMHPFPGARKERWDAGVAH